jgi:hypothetical protein
MEQRVQSDGIELTYLDFPVAATVSADNFPYSANPYHIFNFH